VKNYVIADIEDPHKPYPSAKGREFKSLQEYLEIARKSILYFAPKGYTKTLSSSEDAISMIAYKVMLADWRYEQEKGCSENTWRYKAAKYAVLDFLNSQGKVKNKMATELRTYDFDSFDVVEDYKQHSPTKNIREEERIGRIRNRLQFAMQNSKLSNIQKECLRLRYFELEQNGEHFAYAKIGKMVDPPISRQAVEQNIKRALMKLKFVLKSNSA
jgi:RNA polymerase sigma factor (sigma-70 family)